MYKCRILACSLVILLCNLLLFGCDNSKTSSSVDVEKGECLGCNLSGLDLSALDWDELNLRDSNLSDSDMRNISLEDATSGGSFPFTIRRLTKDGSGGVKSKAKNLSVKVKPGLEHATVMRLSGMGHEHLHGESGDVKLTIRIDAGEGRRWEDGALVQEVEVPFSTLVLGGKVKITTPEGKTGNLTIPENSRIGDRRRMKGMGYIGGSLDLEFILAEIEELTEQQLQAIENLRHHGL